VPRWAFGLVLLEDVIDAVVEDGMDRPGDRPAAMRWMAELAQRGWIEHLDEVIATSRSGSRALR
jgi:hypothetical protein